MLMENSLKPQGLKENSVKPQGLKENSWKPKKHAPTFTPNLIIKNSNSDSWFRGIHLIWCPTGSGNI